MWLSQYHAPPPLTQIPALWGTVSLSSKTLAVVLDSERRDLPLIAPGGYHWMPANRQPVLILRAGEEDAPCLLGVEMQPCDERLQPGEIWLSANGIDGIHLRNDGCIDLVGTILYNGALPTPPEPSLPPVTESEGGTP